MRQFKKGNSVLQDGCENIAYLLYFVDELEDHIL
jgi:hypothetical protein